MSLEVPEPMNNIDDQDVMAPESPEPSSVPDALTAPPQSSHDASTAQIKRRTRSQKQTKHSRMFRDAIAFEVPLEITADVGVALKRTRDRRILALQQAFPSLAPSTKQQLPTDKASNGGDDVSNSAEEKKIAGEYIMENDDEPMSEGTPDASQKQAKKKKKQAKALSIMPQRSDFGNVLDYLEAKYVQGVMLDEADNAEEVDDEGAGSVYSETSFLDDTDLRRTVAEQVLAHTTTTKVELMQEDAEEFFVNVGNLEVEETEMTNDKYDPLKDINAPPKKRKRQSKTAASDGDAKSFVSTKSNGTANGKKKKVVAANGGSDGTAATSGKASTTPKASSLSVASSKVAKKKPKAAKDVENQKPNTPNKKAAAMSDEANGADDVSVNPVEEHAMTEDSAELKANAMHWYEELTGMIKRATPEELPRRKTSERVALVCPPDKRPGDLIMFHNPHVPGQKLKVEIPKNTLPGGNFKVTVPVPQLEEDESVDHNRLSRPFYDALDDYSRAYDEWCDAEALIQKAQGNAAYAVHLEKRKKFDDLMAMFPSNLMTPVDGEYMRKLLRRARQNRSKREKTLAQKGGGSPGTKGSAITSKPKEPPRAVVKVPETTKPKPSSTATVAQPPKETITGPTVALPSLSSQFANQEFSLEDFQRTGNE